MTVSCRDTDAIPKCAEAGLVKGEGSARYQVMHNGLRVVAGGYYGDWMTAVIRGLNGHHEPQEELLFHRLLAECRPGSLMVELGSFWAYYSLWFLSAVPQSRAVCVEPDAARLEIGRRNAELNGLDDRIVFETAWVGAEAVPAHTAMCETTQSALTLPCFDMSAIAALSGEEDIEMLHLDIQGAELGFLGSISGYQDRVRFVVVSTHHACISGSPTTHADCLDTIRALGGHVLAEHSVQESFSGDGLIAASFRAGDAGMAMPVISRNWPEHSLFGVS